MKKLVMIAVVFFVTFLSVSAKKTERIFKELTQTMLVSMPMETVKHENVVVSYWKIKGGIFCYIKESQEFRGKHKSYNFISTSDATIFLGITKKEKRHAKKNLKSDIISSRELY